MAQQGRKVQPDRPGINDYNSWHAYWEAQNQPWRTEPEIDTERQEFLAKRRSITPNIEEGLYPFKDVKLSRADVEWLLQRCGKRLSQHLALPFVRREVATMLEPPLRILSRDGK